MGCRSGGVGTTPGMVWGGFPRGLLGLSEFGLLDSRVGALFIVHGDGCFPLLEEGVVEDLALVDQGHGAVTGFTDGDAAPPQAVALTVALERVETTAELEAQILGESLGVLQAEDWIELLGLCSTGRKASVGLAGTTAWRRLKSSTNDGTAMLATVSGTGPGARRPACERSRRVARRAAFPSNTSLPRCLIAAAGRPQCAQYSPPRNPSTCTRPAAKDTDGRQENGQDVRQPAGCPASVLGAHCSGCLK